MLDAFASGGPHKVCRTVRGSARAHYAASVSSLVLGIMFCLPQSAGGGASTAAVPRYARARRTHSRHASLGALRAVVAFAYARYHVFFTAGRERQGFISWENSRGGPVVGRQKADGAGLQFIIFARVKSNPIFFYRISVSILVNF